MTQMENTLKLYGHGPADRMPRYTETKSNLKYEGFTPERQFFVAKLINEIGLPTDRISKVRYEVNKNSNQTTLGQAHLITGEVTFFKSMDKIPAIAQVGVGVHEIVHVNSPFVAENQKAYGSKEAMKSAQENAKLVAVQTEKTHKFLNPYHKALFKKYVAGNPEDRDIMRFIEETNAIMMELRFTNPSHLKQVLEAQNKDTVKNIANQIDRTLLALMPQFKGDPNQLNQHISQLRRNYLLKKNY